MKVRVSATAVFERVVEVPDEYQDDVVSYLADNEVDFDWGDFVEYLDGDHEVVEGPAEGPEAEEDRAIADFERRMDAALRAAEDGE